MADFVDSTAFNYEQGQRARKLFAAVCLVSLLLVAGWPLLRTFWFSLTDASLASLSSEKYRNLQQSTPLALPDLADGGELLRVFPASRQRLDEGAW